jgi:hypothetical protein
VRDNFRVPVEPCRLPGIVLGHHRKHRHRVTEKSADCPDLGTDPMTETLPRCQRCGGDTEFETLVQPLGSMPGARIYRCVKCQQLIWVKWWADRSMSESH